MGGMAERPSGRGWRLLRAVCWGKGCFSGILMLVSGDRLGIGIYIIYGYWGGTVMEMGIVRRCMEWQ